MILPRFPDKVGRALAALLFFAWDFGALGQPKDALRQGLLPKVYHRRRLCSPEVTADTSGLISAYLLI